MTEPSAAPDAVVKNVLDSDLRVQLVAEIAEHGFTAVGEPPLQEGDGGYVDRATIEPVVISFAITIAPHLAWGMAARVAHLIAVWRRERKQRERLGARQVWVIYDPGNEVVTEVDIPDYDETSPRNGSSRCR